MKTRFGPAFSNLDEKGGTATPQSEAVFPQLEEESVPVARLEGARTSASACDVVSIRDGRVGPFSLQSVSPLYSTVPRGERNMIDEDGFRVGLGVGSGLKCPRRKGFVLRVHDPFSPAPSRSNERVKCLSAQSTTSLLFPRIPALCSERHSASRPVFLLPFGRCRWLFPPFPRRRANPAPSFPSFLWTWASPPSALPPPPPPLPPVRRRRGKVPTRQRG